MSRPVVGADLSPRPHRCVDCLYVRCSGAWSTQLKAEVSSTSSTLEDTRTALAREGAARSQLDSEVSALRLDRERDLRDLRAAHSAELTAAREDGVRRAEEAAAARSSEVYEYLYVYNVHSRSRFRFGGISFHRCTEQRCVKTSLLCAARARGKGLAARCRHLIVAHKRSFSDTRCPLAVQRLASGSTPSAPPPEPPPPKRVC